MNIISKQFSTSFGRKMVSHGNAAWRHQMETFSASLAFVREVHPLPVDCPHKGQWLLFSLICAYTNGRINNRDAGDLKNHRAHYNVIVMECCYDSNHILIKVTRHLHPPWFVSKL